MPATPQLQVVPPGERKRRKPSATLEYLDQSRVVAILIFVATVLAIAAISFVRLNTMALPVQPGQLSQIRVTAGTTFTYESAIETAQVRSQLIARVPPVYELDLRPGLLFEQHVRELLHDLDKNVEDPGLFSVLRSQNTRSTALEEVTRRFNSKGRYFATSSDLARLLTLGNAAQRQKIVESGLGFLRELQQSGIHAATGPESSSAISLLNVQQADGEVSEAHVQSLGEALTYLRVNIVADGSNREASLALFRVLRNGVTPNLVFNPAGSEKLRERATVGLKPVVVSIDRGHVIIEPGTTVTPAQYEILHAYRAHLAASGGSASEEGYQLLNRVLLVLGMVLASVIYIRIEDRETLLSNARLGLLASVVIINLALVRISYSLAGLPYFLENFSAAALLPYIAPTAFAPLIVAILIDAGSAIFMALLISIFTSIIYGNRIDLLVVTFLASLAGIYYAREVRRRSRVVKAAGIGGLVVASVALIIGLLDQTPFATVLWQMGAGLATGVITGIAVAGLLPVLESLFNRTTDITLLELTDYNHPLLRRMQMEAPGTYHHSLIIAQLAENAASVIGANPLLCRVCALFHDIGKTEQPGYFTENQGEGPNPHDKLAPAHSAAIIKGHVEKGVELAREHNLPRAAVDVIRQHHGTTMCQFFYKKACQSRSPNKHTPEEATEFEAIFRYDGPKPQFKESAIVFLADPVEAATRSLRTVNAEQLRELIDRIFGERTSEGQLDEAPLTFEEFAKIKTSFTITLLGMLHARVAYNTAAPSGSVTVIEEKRNG
ncbi:HD family phosphohydrolase [Oleiharenicola lentus]|uniref:HD family phosphohydrolase n=1 Tax=Oleiharenicola lentus TaxID=2508720 RepID=UPI003F666FA6